MPSQLPRRDRREVAHSIKDWVTVDDSTLSVENASKYKKHAAAIRLYAAGAALNRIHAETGVSTKELYRYLDRCETENPDGRINGWRGIVPGGHVVLRHVSNLDLGTRSGYANCFMEFLVQHPNISANLGSLAINGWRTNEKGPKRKLSIKKIKAEMLKDCRIEGLTISDYPLSVANGAYAAVRRFVKRVRQQHTGGTYPAGGISDLPLVTRCYQRLEADGHKKDVICTVEFPSPTSRGVYYLPIQRLWIIPVLESQSTAALGYSIAYGLNYGGSDLVRAIRSAMLPWKPMELTAPGIRYPSNGGFPSGIDEALAFICSDEILLDNHKGHLSAESVAQIHKTLGATPICGGIENQNARACAEGFFSLFEERVFHTLPSTTGSNPGAKRGKDPTGNAVKYHITDQHIHELAEVSLARYNAESPPGSSLSRIEILQRYVNDPRSLVRRIPVCQRETLSLYDIALLLTIKGNEQKGIRPHVYWLESRYTNEVIASAYGLIGKKLKAYAHGFDIRTLKAFFESGADAGYLLCERRFRNTPHSVTTRKHANASRRTGGHHPDAMGDDIAGYTSSIVAKAPKSKVSATELARIKAEARALAQTHRQSGISTTSDGQQEKANAASAKRQLSQWAEKLNSLGTRF